MPPVVVICFTQSCYIRYYTKILRFFSRIIIRENVQGNVCGIIRRVFQDYKPLRATVVICSTLVNTQIHIDSISSVMY